MDFFLLFSLLKSLIRRIFRDIVLAILSQDQPLATRATSWFHNLCNMKKKSCVASASKNIARGAAAFPGAVQQLESMAGVGDNISSVWAKSEG